LKMGFHPLTTKAVLVAVVLQTRALLSEDEEDLMLIELVAPGSVFPNIIRKQIQVSCKAQINLGQSQKTRKLCKLHLV
jgi:hypothetical protein